MIKRYLEEVANVAILRMDDVTISCSFFMLHKTEDTLYISIG